MDNEVEKLRRLIRDSYDGSQRAFAAAIGKSAAQVNQWLTGYRGFSAASQVAIEKRLRLGIGYFDGSSSEPLVVDNKALRHKARIAMTQLLKENGIQLDSQDEQDQIYIDFLEDELFKLFKEEPEAADLSVNLIRRLIKEPDGES